jgi:hypothetical protein
MEAPNHGASMDIPTGADYRVKAFGNQLIEVHIWLREELTQLREDLDSYLEGRRTRPRDLRAHCLSFCAMLDRHHSGEDEGAFHVLARHYPELRPVLQELTRDHRLVDGVLKRIEELFGGRMATAVEDMATIRSVRSELDDLAALLETHLRYEEKKIVAALNSLSPRPGTAESDQVARATKLRNA